MRVLHVIARLNLGGTATYITRLATELPNHGVETYIATGFVQGAEIEDPSAKSINVIRLSSLGRSFNPVNDFLARKQLEKIISELKPDIIHTHTFKAGFIVRIRKQSVPVVHTFHGHLLYDPEFLGFRSKVIIEIEKRLAKNAVVLVSVGSRVADDLLKQKIGKRQQYVNIPPGVVALTVLPRAAALKNLGISENGHPIIGWIARVTGVKNPQRALTVARAMPNVHFILAGGGDLLGEIKAAAPSNVSVIGWANTCDVLSASDIILSTSENEGMPVALIEAQLGGKPVVATDVGSIPEVILNNETGIITKNDVDSIVIAIESLLLDKQKYTEMSTLASARANSIFSVDRMIQAHIKLYNSILE
jgi:glycosyltransferase involved in cell wall biosynthesis